MAQKCVILLRMALQSNFGTKYASSGVSDTNDSAILVSFSTFMSPNIASTKDGLLCYRLYLAGINPIF